MKRRGWGWRKRETKTRPRGRADAVLDIHCVPSTEQNPLTEIHDQLVLTTAQ